MCAAWVHADRDRRDRVTLKTKVDEESGDLRVAVLPTPFDEDQGAAHYVGVLADAMGLSEGRYCELGARYGRELTEEIASRKEKA